LERKLFAPPFTPAEALRPQPAWARIHAELRRSSVTLLLLGWEYRAGQRRGTATAASVTSTPNGRANCRRRCAKPSPPASACSSTTPGRPWMW
jgi:hypothetical protein